LKTATPPPSPVFVRNQLWKVSNGYIRIGEIGKSLVHYRHGAMPHHRGRPTHIISSEALKAYLQKNEAVLVQE